MFVPYLFLLITLLIIKVNSVSFQQAFAHTRIPLKNV